MSLGEIGGFLRQVMSGGAGRTVRWDGAAPRNSKDAIDADWYSDLQDAINASTGRPIVVPSSRTQANPISVQSAIQNKCRIRGDGLESQITYTGAGAFFTLDPSATPDTNSRRQFWQLENLRIVGPGSGVAGSIGLKINNGISGTIRDVTVTGFETGVLFEGHDLANGAACYYNNAFNLVAVLNGTNIRLKGVANSIKFFGGRAALGDVGVKVDAGVNDAAFFGMDIEANFVYGLDLAGYGCTFSGCRHENQLATYEIRFDTSGGEGRKHMVMGYFAHADPNSRILWDTNRDNLVIFPGFINLGDQANAAAPYALRLSRSGAADAKPLLELADTYSASGAPIGVRYNGRRTGTIGVELTRFDGSTDRTYLRAMPNLSTAQAELWFGKANSNDIDALLTRRGDGLIGGGDATVAIPAQIARREMQVLARPGTTTIDASGINTPSIGGSAANADDAIGPYIAYDTGAVSGNGGGWSLAGTLMLRGDWESDLVCSLKTGADITSVRYWIGMFSGSPNASATPAVHVAAFRYDTGADGTAFWRCCTDNASGSPTVTTTTVAITADTAYRMRVHLTATEATFFINDLLVATHTTTLPTSSQSLSYWTMVTTLTAAARIIKLSRLALATR